MFICHMCAVILNNDDWTGLDQFDSDRAEQLRMRIEFNADMFGFIQTGEKYSDHGGEDCELCEMHTFEDIYEFEDISAA